MAAHVYNALYAQQSDATNRTLKLPRNATTGDYSQSNSSIHQESTSRVLYCNKTEMPNLLEDT